MTDHAPSDDRAATAAAPDPAHVLIEQQGRDLAARHRRLMRRQWRQAEAAVLRRRACSMREHVHPQLIAAFCAGRPRG